MEIRARKREIMTKLITSLWLDRMDNDTKYLWTLPVLFRVVLGAQPCLPAAVPGQV